ncbi:MAG: hypothetical protein D6730_22065 [Bacteroidetes bacterium]|nr:MAG: hypothetical protein D6730_22065 [Bacteroidota bacterium]
MGKGLKCFCHQAPYRPGFGRPKPVGAARGLQSRRVLNEEAFKEIRKAAKSKIFKSYSKHIPKKVLRLHNFSYFLGIIVQNKLRSQV